MKTSKMTQCLRPILTAISLAILPVHSPAQNVQCVETNGQKFLLPPNTDGGLDVKDSGGIVLADDFFCNITGPISDIHLWGSWLNDVDGVITNFWLGIYSDIPAVTNFSNGQVVPSRPGTLLWQQSFTAGQFAINPYATGSEFFYDPTIGAFTGTDTQAWYYCFYPTNPFTQQGTTAKPTNYWLAAYAQVQGTTGSGPSANYGWKTSLYPYNDPAVWGNVAGGIPVGNWQSMTNSQTRQIINLSFKLTTQANPPPPPPPVTCDDTNGIKNVQWPNIDGGRDVWDDGPWVLADDFVCTQTGPITGIHLWGSWLNDQVQTNALTFTLAIYSDVPATNSPVGQTPSHPGSLLWTESFAPNQYNESFWSFGQEAFLDPASSSIQGPDSQIWYYCFYPTNIFTQQGTTAAPVVYWLMAYAQLPVGNAINFGWKSTTSVQNDTSVYAPWPGSVPVGNPGWTPTKSENGSPLDLAFIMANTSNSVPPMVCTNASATKYEQPPNLAGGFDIKNDTYVLADDFICSYKAPISDIHLWGSWLNSQAVTNTLVFWLGIYDDVPKGPNNPNSHPGTNLLWQQWFAPGQYEETFWGIGQEAFFDPGQLTLSSETNVWYYCFFPTNPFVQQGTPTNHLVYWLASYVQGIPAGIPLSFGRKTTVTVSNDTSVFASWPGVPPTNNPGWTPTALPTGGPLDLSFKLTESYCPPLSIQYLGTNSLGTNRVVVLTWPSGILQISTAADLYTTNVLGTYVDVPGATSPYTNTTGLPASFFRLRCN